MTSREEFLFTCFTFLCRRQKNSLSTFVLSKPDIGPQSKPSASRDDQVSTSQRRVVLGSVLDELRILRKEIAHTVPTKVLPDVRGAHKFKNSQILQLDSAAKLV